MYEHHEHSCNTHGQTPLSYGFCKIRTLYQLFNMFNSTASEATAPTHFHKPSGARCGHQIKNGICKIRKLHFWNEEICISPLLPCTNRTSEATASTHLHRSSEATVSMAPLPKAGTKDVAMKAHNQAAGHHQTATTGCGTRTCVSRVHESLRTVKCLHRDPLSSFSQ